MQWLIVLFLALASFSSQAFGQSGKPFPQAKITEDQWQQYFDESKIIPDALIQQGQDQTLITVNTTERHESYFFTTRLNPAYPAAVKIVAFVDKSGETHAQVFGNYAGSKDAFDPWFRALVDRVAKSKP